MSVSTLAILSGGDWRDYYGQWNPRVLPYIEPLETSDCHNPRWALVPALDDQIVGQSGKITNNFNLPPGSIIWGLMVYGGSAIQITDVGLGHKLYQQPASAGTVSNLGIVQGNMPSPFILPCPWPVTGDGLFTLELWGTTGDRIFVLLGVAEVKACQSEMP